MIVFVSVYLLLIFLLIVLCPLPLKHLRSFSLSLSYFWCSRPIHLDLDHSFYTSFPSSLSLALKHPPISLSPAPRVRGGGTAGLSGATGQLYCFEGVRGHRIDLMTGVAYSRKRVHHIRPVFCEIQMRAQKTIISVTENSLNTLL